MKVTSVRVTTVKVTSEKVISVRVTSGLPIPLHRGAAGSAQSRELALWC